MAKYNRRYTYKVIPKDLAGTIVEPDFEAMGKKSLLFGKGRNRKSFVEEMREKYGL